MAEIRNRYELHELLCTILGSRNVYFQPPETVKMVYPAIVYHLANIRNFEADNSVYRQSHHYTITVIDPDPDSTVAAQLSTILRSRFDRMFSTEGLNHFVFTIYY